MRKKLFICGIDEAGRGPLAGPLSVGGAIFYADQMISGINDSKKLTEKKREALFEEIKTKALAYSNVLVETKDIDQINILQATKLGMRLVAEDIISKINLKFPDTHNLVHFLVDGNQKFCTNQSQDPIIKGDGLVKVIGCASILAKVSRDRIMMRLGKEHPEYGFESHKGYPTKHHKQMIKEHGVLPFHRKTFAGVKEHLANLT